MSTISVFQLQFCLSIVAFSLLAWVMARPALSGLGKREALLWLTAPHMFRHIGMVFIVPELVGAEMPASFAISAAYGDLLTGVLALGAFVMLAARWPGALALAGLFNVVGLVDLGRALPQVDVSPYFEVAWYVPTFLVPLLLVTHAMSLVRLVRREQRSQGDTVAATSVSHAHS